MIRRFLVACLVAAVLTSMVFHIFMILKIGYFDGWFFISFFTVGVLAFLVSLPAGLIISRLR